MLGDAVQHVGEPGLEIETVKRSRSNRGVDGGGPLPPHPIAIGTTVAGRLAGDSAHRLGSEMAAGFDPQRIFGARGDSGHS